MGLFNFVRTAVLGEDVDAIQAESNRLDAEIRAANERERSRPGGRIYDRTERERGEEAAIDAYNIVLMHEDEQEQQSADLEGQVGDAFREGLDEGARNIRQIIGAPFTLAPAFLKVIPWQLWLLGAALLFFWLGGGPWLLNLARGRLARR